MTLICLSGSSRPRARPIHASCGTLSPLPNHSNPGRYFLSRPTYLPTTSIPSRPLSLQISQLTFLNPKSCAKTSRQTYLKLQSLSTYFLGALPLTSLHLFPYPEFSDRSGDPISRDSLDNNDYRPAAGAGSAGTATETLYSHPRIQLTIQLPR